MGNKTKSRAKAFDAPSTKKDASGKFVPNAPSPLTPVIRTPAEILENAFARLDQHAMKYALAVDDFKKQVAEGNLFYALDAAGDRAVQGEAYLRTHKRFREGVEKFRNDPVGCLEYAKGYLSSQVDRVVREAEYPSRNSSSPLKNIMKEAESQADALLVHAIQIFIVMMEDAAKPQEKTPEPTQEGTQP